MTDQGGGPGYKQTEVGVIPEDWDSRRIGDVCQIFGRIGFRGYTVADIVSEGRGAISLSPSNIYDSILKLSKNTYITWEKWRESPEIQIFNDDIILVKTGSTVGKAAIVKGLSSAATLNPQLIVLKNRRIDDAFLGYIVVSECFQNQLTATVAGGALPALSQREVAKYWFPCPRSRDEQRAIAQALVDADELIAALEGLIAKKRDLKQAAMQHLLTGKTRLPGFSGEWEMKRLGDLGPFLKGSGVRRDQAQSGEIPCVRYGELYTSHSDIVRRFVSRISRQVAEEATLLQHGDLLFAGSGETKAEIGKCAAFAQHCEAYAGGDIVILRQKEGNPIFLGYLMNTRAVARQKSNMGQGDAVVHISARALARVEVELPRLKEQTAIAEVLSDMDTELDTLEAQAAKARAVKQGMMQELLTGRLRLV